MTDLPATIDSNYLTLLDSVDAVIYVTDMNTREILFLNKMAREHSNGKVGAICWETLQSGQTGPCPFCTNDRLVDKDGNPTGPYVWEFQNTINGEWWECHDQAIHWSDGRLVRLEIATNITDRKQLEIEHKEIVSTLKEAQRIAKMGSWDLNLQTNELHWSDEIYNIFGISSHEFEATYEKFLGMIHPEDRNHVDETYQSSVKNRTPYAVIHRLLLEGGEIKHVRENGQTFYAEDGTPVRSIGTVQDITDQIMTQKALRENEQRFQELFENMSSGVVIYNAIEDGNDFIIQKLNQAAEKIENVNREEVIGRRLTDVFPGVEKFGLLEVFQDVWNNGVARHHPVTIYKDERIEGWRNNFVYKLPSGEIVAIYEDVTAQKQSEQELLTKKEGLSFALHAARSGMWDWNIKTGKIHFDENYYTMAGYDPYEFPQEFTEWEKRVHPDDIAQVQQLIQQVLSSKSPQLTAEFRFKTKANSWMWILGQGKIIERDANDDPVRFVGLHTGIDHIKTTEQALRESEKRHELALSGAELGTWDWNPQTGEVIFNERWAEMLGYRHDELTQHVNTWTALLHPDDVPKTIAALEAHLEKTTPFYKTEFRMKTRQGGWKWILDTGKVFERDSQGNAVRIVGTHLDITERKQAEEALKISEEKYRGFFENSVVGIYQSSPEGRYLKVNKTFAEMLGFDSPEELISATTDIATQFYIDPNDRIYYKKLLADHGYAFNFVHKFRHKKGSQLWITTSSRRVKSTTDDNEYYEGVAIDITEQVQAESALRESEENLLITLNSIGDAVIAVDTDHRVIRMNPVAEQLTGWSQTQAAKKNLTEIFHIINTKTGQAAENPVGKVLKTGKIVALANHAILIAKDGRESKIADSAAPIRNKEGQITGVVLVFRDVTEEYRIRDELHKMQQLESIGTLAGGIAHDFNNILAGIFGNIALAKQRTETDHPGRKYLEQAEISANRAKNLTGQLLTFAKGGEPIKDQISLGELIEEVAKFDLSGSKIKLLFKQQNNLWTAEVDRAQIQQVISNLVINAKQAMKEGGHLHIDVENYHHSGHHLSELKPGKYIQVSVRDEGAGIDEKSLPYIFDPYFSTKSTGRGLGLATVYSIIKRHEGYVKVESRLGKGSSFTFYLPAVDNIQQDNIEEAYDSEEFEKRPLRVLLMDDEEIIRTLTTEMLTRLGNTTDTATNGEDAVEMYRQALKEESPYNLVIMDLTIPGGMGGKEAIKDLLNIDPEAKVIVSSGYADDPVMAHYRSYGFKGVVAKPYTYSELKRTIEKVLKC